MRSAELLRYRETLLAKAKELELMLRGVDITIESSADPLDEVQRAADRELAIESADRESAMLADVRLALHRIQDRTYGLCVDCEEVIASRRLSAVPWASRCIRCQEAFESAAQEPEDEPADATQRQKRLMNAA